MRLALLSAACLITLVAPLDGQANPPQSDLPTIELPAELDRVLRDYEAAWRAGDSDGLAALFTEDGFVLSPGNPPRRGTEAITSAYGDPGGPLALSALAYAESTDVAYIVGVYAYGTGQPGGKFLLALRRGPDGRWLIAADMDNSIARR
jgi:ketosteroid isomerase-like protein